MKLNRILPIALTLLLSMGLISIANAQKSVKLSDAQIENIIKRSYQYVAMYNFNQKLTLAEEGMTTRGYNKGLKNTDLLDHTAEFIARPNNDSIYQLAMLDLRKDVIEHGLGFFKTKGQIPKHLLHMQSVIGPSGLPATEAVYPPVTTSDSQPMNAQNDYVIRMGKYEMPPAKAFWSMTLYDSANGFFIPNDRKKYSVGENGGMKLNADGGIEVYISEKKPENLPDDSWLPINRKDETLDVTMRLYMPDFEKYKTWTPPKAEFVK